MESQYKELKIASTHEEDRLKLITQENEDLTVEIDELTTKISKWYLALKSSMFYHGV